MNEFEKKLKMISVIVIIVTAIKVLIDAYNVSMISFSDTAILDIEMKKIIFASYKRSFIQSGINIIYGIVGIFVSNKKINKFIAIACGTLSVLVCVIMQFYEKAILSCAFCVILAIVYIYFAWKTE